MNIRDQIRQEVDDETRHSPYRDHASGARVHPDQHDLITLVNFVMARRRRQPGALDACRRALQSVDTAALRELTHIIRTGGLCDLSTERRCDRIETWCSQIDNALAIAKGGAH